MTLATAIGASFSMTPPCWFRLRSALTKCLDEVDPFDDDPVGLGDELEDLALFPLVLAPDDDDEVVLLERDLGHQRTSGAREMIFMNFLSRSSRPTGPKTRVPTGSPALSMMTAALSSKRM